MIPPWALPLNDSILEVWKYSMQFCCRPTCASVARLERRVDPSVAHGTKKYFPPKDSEGASRVEKSAQYSQILRNLENRSLLFHLFSIPSARSARSG